MYLHIAVLERGYLSRQIQSDSHSILIMYFRLPVKPGEYLRLSLHRDSFSRIPHMNLLTGIR